MITLEDIVAAEKAKRAIADLWYAAKKRYEDTSLPVAKRADAAFEEMVLRPQVDSAYHACDALIAQAVREAGQ